MKQLLLCFVSALFLFSNQSYGAETSPYDFVSDYISQLGTTENIRAFADKERIGLADSVLFIKNAMIFIVCFRKSKLSVTFRKNVR